MQKERCQKKRYTVYIDIPDDHVNIMYASTYFKITAWLLAKKIRNIYRDSLITVIYDRKKGVITYEK